MSFALPLIKAFTMMQGDLENRGFELDEDVEADLATDRLFALGKESMTPVLSARHNTFTQSNFRAMFLGQNGVDVACGFARFDNLGAESAGEFYPRLIRDKYEFRQGQSIKSRGGQLSKRVRGNVIYFGDLYIRPEVRGSLDVLEAFVGALQMACVLSWQPDWICAFLRNKDVMRGAAARYNLTEIEYRANEWVAAPAGRGSSECFAATTARSFGEVMSSRWVQHLEDKQRLQ